MRKTALLLSMLMLFCGSAFSQDTRKISGQITSENGSPIPFASIIEAGTKSGTTADANGSFMLTIKTASSLTVSATGFKSKTVTPSGNTITITLAQNADEMAEVIVTGAFGIKKMARITPYSAAVVGEEQLRIIPQTNINSAIAGKVAGVQFRGQSPVKLDNQGTFRVRGGQGLGDVDPIYVVDGTIVGSFDLNPDDVEEITFLKGANATALFGGRAINGAVIVTTKKKGQRGTAGIEVTQGITFDKVYILPKYQNIYAGGADKDLTQFHWNASMPAEWQALDGKYFHEYTDDASWGPRMVGQEYIPWYAWVGGTQYSYKTASLTPQPDNTRDFWNTGITSVTSVAFSKAGEGYNTRLSYTNNTIKGLLPYSGAEKHTLFGTLSVNLNEHFTVGMNINYVAQKINGQFDDGYSNQSQGGFNQWFHRDLDMGIMKELKDLRTPIGTIQSWNLRNNPGGSIDNMYKGNYWYNFYTWFDQLDYQQTRDRLFGNAFLEYKLNQKFMARVTVRKSLLNLSYENIIPTILEVSAGQTGILADYSTGQRRINEMNYEGLISYNDKFLDKLEVSVNAGGNLMKYTDTRVDMSTVNGLNVPELYAISNSKDQPSLTNDRKKEQNRALFAFGDLEWDKTFSVTWAIRNDWYSTLFQGSNSLLSPSVGASIAFSEFTKNHIPWLSFGKVFASWGKKPTALGIYDNNFLYSVNANQWDGNFLMTTPNTFVDPSVKGALITTIEGGVDLKFLRNRLGLNFIYYWEDIDKSPVTVSVFGASGFTSKVVNAAHIRRKGIEITLTATPASSKDFRWDITKTFGYLIDNPVISIAEGVPRYTLSQSAFTTRVPQVFLEENQQWGQLIGGAMALNDEGLPMLNASTGLYTRETEHNYGSVVPKVTGGLVNTLLYKNFVMNFTIDYQVGGKFFSLSEMWGHYSGLLEATAEVNDNGMNVRDPLGDGGGVHVVGVDAADGHTPVDMYVDAQAYWHQFYNNLYDPYVHDLTFVKLREISLGYQIPVQKILNIGKIVKGATFSIVARNPWLIYRETKNFDPSEISNVFGENGQFPGTRSIGFNLKLNF